MSYDIRFPKITGVTEKEQLLQVKSYLHQLVEQLQWAFNNIESSSSNNAVVTVQKTSTSTAPTTAQASFDAIKGLIIKSADIVEAYYEEINKRLIGTYTAKSEFGTYTEQTTQDILETSTAIENLYSNIQIIVSDIENLEYTIVEANAHIKSGLLYYDDGGVPIYGLEIGQKNIIDGEEVFNKYARFTSDRLSFYDQNNTEVAYISDYKLYITNAEVTGSLKLGGFQVDTSNGLALKWVGRG